MLRIERSSSPRRHGEHGEDESDLSVLPRVLRASVVKRKNEPTEREARITKPHKSSHFAKCAKRTQPDSADSYPMARPRLRMKSFASTRSEPMTATAAGPTASAAPHG